MRQALEAEPKNKQKFENSKKELKNNEAVLSKHRSRLSHGFKTLANIAGILPISVYEATKGHSPMFFSKSHGGAFVEECQKLLDSKYKKP